MRDPGDTVWVIARAGADREINPWILKHPLRVIALDHRRLGGKEGRIEANRLSQILNGHVHVQAFHRYLL
jgi:hypothetical protein